MESTPWRAWVAFLSSLNETIDVEMSDMAQAVQMYHNPIPVAYDADVSWHPIVAPGKWMRVNSVPTDLERGPTPVSNISKETSILLEVGRTSEGWLIASLKPLESLSQLIEWIPTRFRPVRLLLPSKSHLWIMPWSVENHFEFMKQDLARVALTVGRCLLQASRINHARPRSHTQSDMAIANDRSSWTGPGYPGSRFIGHGTRVPRDDCDAAVRDGS